GVCSGNPLALVLIGNGDGTFQPPLPYLASNVVSTVALFDFDGDGEPDLLASNVFNGGGTDIYLGRSVRATAPSQIHFGSQGIGSTGFRSIPLVNPSNIPLLIHSITASGNFAQSNDCPAALPVHAACTVTASFTPSAAVLSSGSITIS